MVKFSIKLSIFLYLFLIITLLSADTWSNDEIIRINSFSLKQLDPVVDESNKYLFDINAN